MMIRSLSAIVCLFGFLSFDPAVSGLLFHSASPYRIDRTLATAIESTDSAFTTLGGNVTSSPGCLSRNGNQFHCFFVTLDNQIGYATVKKGKAVFQTINGKVNEDQPQVIAYGKGGVFAFFVNHDGKLIVVGMKTKTKYDKKATKLDFGRFLEAPACTTMSSNNIIFCAIRSTNGKLNGMWNKGNGWEKPYQIIDNPDSPLGCAYNTATSRVHCWSTDIDHRISERIFTSEGFPLLPRWWAGDCLADGRIEVKMLRGAIPLPRALAYSTNQMVDNLRKFGGNLKSEPSCAQPSDDVMDCYARDVDYGIQRNYELMGMLYVKRTTGWIHYGGGPFTGNPSCSHSQKDQKIHCFIRNEKDQLVDATFASGREFSFVATT